MQSFYFDLHKLREGGKEKVSSNAYTWNNGFEFGKTQNLMYRFESQGHFFAPKICMPIEILLFFRHIFRMLDKNVYMEVHYV